MPKSIRMDREQLLSYSLSRKKRKKFFQPWSRAASDCFRKEVVGMISDRFPYTDGQTPIDYLKSLPEVDWSDIQHSLELSQVRALFSKDEDLLSTVDREYVALSKFEQSEESCRRVNEFLRSERLAPTRCDLQMVFYHAARKISAILGDPPELDDLDYSFGPGASATCRQKTSARFKLSTPPSTSTRTPRDALDIAKRFPSWLSYHKKVVMCHGEIEFVPKNWKTYRTIMIEPTLNGMYQRAIGGFMKRKLLAAGVNLYDQSINRNRARLGSLNNDLVTIDLSSASDSIAYGLVLELLPIDWFELLDKFRTHTARYHDRVFVLEKFSSMGNGYTFELESLLFFSLAYGIATVCKLPFDVTVYGDDIICGRDLGESIVKFFPDLGFAVNREKSFFDGPFRESCGFDALNGVDVRPFYIKDRVSFHTLFNMYNFLQRKEIFDVTGKLRSYILSLIPSDLILWGPDGYGDGHLVTSDHISVYGKPGDRKRGFSGWMFETFVMNPERDIMPLESDILLPSYASTSAKYYGCSVDRAKLQGPYRLGLDSLQLIEDIGSLPDHFVIRRTRGSPRSAKVVRVYVLGG